MGKNVKLSFNELVVITLKIHIFLGFFVYRDNTLETFFLGIIFLVYMYVKKQSLMKMLKNNGVLGCILVTIVSVSISILFKNFGQMYVLGLFICLLLLEMLCENNVFVANKHKKIDLFYYVMFSFTTGYMIYNYSNGNIDVTTLMGDQNYTGILVFCIFLYANKKNYISGVLLALVYGIVFSDSRTYLFMMILFYVFHFLKERIYTFFKDKKIIFPLFLFSTFIIIIISYFWTYYVSDSGYSTGFFSLNDYSNRQRAASIIYALQMISNTPSLLFCGYGNKLLLVMGISDRNFIMHPKFLGLRLVQAHNSVINLAVKNGLIPTICYFYILSKILNRFFNEDNMPYFFPFFLNAMFMHSLFCYQWLIFFVIILALPQGSWKETLHIKIKARSKKLSF